MVYTISTIILYSYIGKLLAAALARAYVHNDNYNISTVTLINLALEGYVLHSEPVTHMHGTPNHNVMYFDISLCSWRLQRYWKCSIITPTIVLFLPSLYIYITTPPFACWREGYIFLWIREHHTKWTPVHSACGAHMDVQLHGSTWCDRGGTSAWFTTAYTEQGWCWSAWGVINTMYIFNWWHLTLSMDRTMTRLRH